MKSTWIISPLVGFALLTANLCAQQWQLIEDFSDLDAWVPLNDNYSCDGEDPEACLRVQEIVTDPVTGSGTVGLFRAAPLNQTTNWGATVLRDITPGIPPEYKGQFTVYFEFAIEDFRMDSVFGTHSATSAYEDFTKFAGFAGIMRVTTGRAGILEVRDEEEAGYVPVSVDPLMANSWYKVWMVHKNNDDFANDPDALTIDFYIQGGPDSEWPEQSLLYEGAWYRDISGAINSFAVVQTTGGPDNPNGNSGLFLRNLYIDYGGSVEGGTDAPNLTEPTGGMSGPTWAGYPVDPEGFVDTGDFIGLINVSLGEWIFNFPLGRFIFMPEGNVGEGGAWGFVLKPQ